MSCKWGGAIIQRYNFQKRKYIPWYDWSQKTFTKQARRLIEDRILDIMLTESFPKAREVTQAPTAMRDTTSSMLPTDSFSGFWRGGNKKRSFFTWVLRPKWTKNLKFPAGNIKELRFYLASFHKMKWGIDLYRNCKICTSPHFPEVEYPLRANGSTLVRVIIMIIIIIIILIAIIFVIKLVFPAQGHPVGRWQLEAEGERGLLPPGCQLSMAGNSTGINHAMSNGHRKVLVEQCGAVEKWSQKKTTLTLLNS